MHAHVHVLPICVSKVNHLYMLPDSYNQSAQRCHFHFCTNLPWNVDVKHVKRNDILQFFNIFAKTLKWLYKKAPFSAHLYWSLLGVKINYSTDFWPHHFVITMLLFVFYYYSKTCASNSAIIATRLCLIKDANKFVINLAFLILAKSFSGIFDIFYDQICCIEIFFYNSTAHGSRSTFFAYISTAKPGIYNTRYWCSEVPYSDYIFCNI